MMEQRNAPRSLGFGFPAACLGAAGVVAALLAPWLVSRIYVFDDLGDYHLALREFYASAIRQGERFDWIPGMFCGYNLQAEGQVGMYHPWHWLIYRVLPLPIAFDLEVVASYPAMLVGMYCFLRRWSLDRTAALIGGMTFAFSGFTLLRFIHLNAVGIVAHVPWLLWATDRLLRGQPDGGRPSWWAGPVIALLTGSQVLLGHPQFLWYALLCEGGYALILVIGLRASPRRLLTLVSAKALGGLCGAVQLLPTIEEVTRPSRVPRAGGLDFDLSHLVTMLAPYLYSGRGFNMRVVTFQTHEHNFYLGALAPVLLLWLASRGPGAWRTPLRAGMAAIAIVGLGLMSIAQTPLSGLYRSLPLVGQFRVNGRYFLLVVLASAALSASALSELRRAPSEPTPSWRSLRRLMIAPALAALVVLASWLSGLVLTMHHNPPALALAGVGLSALAALLTAAAARGVRPAWSALALFVALDLGANGLSHIASTPILDLPSVLAQIPDPPPQEGFRVHFLPAKPGPEADRYPVPDSYLLKGYRLVKGYVAMNPEKLLDYNTVGAQRVAGAGLIYVWGPLEEQREHPGRYVLGLVRWRKVFDPMPRVRLVSRARLSRDPGRDILGLDVAEVALVDRELALDEGPPGSAVLEDDRPGRARVRVEAPARRLLVFSESYHPGWIVEVDGRSAPVVRTYGDFLGCVVEAGTHEVVFRFDPRSLAIGRAVSLAALGVVAAWAALGCLRAARRRLRV